MAIPRVTRGKLLTAVLLVIGIVAATTLVIIGQVGGITTAVFVAVVAIVTVAAFSSVELGLLALIVVAAVDGFLKGLSPGWHTQVLKDYILGICLLRWGWLSVLGHRRRSVTTRVGRMVGLFVAWCVVELFNARNFNFVMAMAGFRMWVIWLPVFFLAYDTLRTRREVERFVIFVAALMLPLALYAIVQYQIGFDHLYALGEGFDVYLKSQYATETHEIELRPPATMISPHSLAGACVMALCLGMGGLGYFRRPRRAEVLILVSLPVVGVALLLTAVRNAYASAFAGLLVMLGLIRRPGLIVAAMLVAGLAAWQVNALTGGNALARLNTIVTEPEYTRTRILTPWRTALFWVNQHPLGGGISTGVGVGRMLQEDIADISSAPEFRTPWAENEYARALIELGLPGLLLFVGMLVACLVEVFRAYRGAQEPRDRRLIAGILAAVVSMMLRLTVGSALYGWPEGILFWCYVAIAVRMPQIEQEEARAGGGSVAVAGARSAQMGR